MRVSNTASFLKPGNTQALMRDRTPMLCAHGSGSCGQQTEHVPSVHMDVCIGWLRPLCMNAPNGGGVTLPMM
jgi:hypothetical protein